MAPSRVLTRRTPRIPQHQLTTSITGSTQISSRYISSTTNLSSPSPSSSISHTPSPQPFQKVFAAPTWSVRSLLTSTTTTASSSPKNTTSSITPKTLHHLLRLSALPPPTTPAEESALLNTLHTQLHFVRAIQAVDTTGIAPLTSIRDESASTAAAVTLDDLREALAGEKVVGFRGRPRRVRDGGERARGAEEILVEDRTRDRRDRGYYVVESGKAKGGE